MNIIVSTYRPPMCPQCGYSLEGLPAEASCPECGLPYGPDHILLFAWANLASSAKSPRILFVAGAATLFLPAMLIFALFLNGPGFHFIFMALRAKPWMVVLFLLSLGFFPAQIAWAFLRRRRNLRTMPAPIQIRLSPNGYAIREGLGSAKIRPWQSTTVFELKLQKDGSPKFVLRARKRWSFDLPLVPTITPETAAWVAERVQSWIVAANETRMKQQA